MRRETAHKTALKRIIKDERLSPHRRLLAELFHLWLDSDEDYKRDIFQIIQANYGTAKKVNWQEGDNKSLVRKIEEEATDALKDFFSKAQEEVQEIQDEVFATDILTSDEPKS